jgi:hypothetical protein
VGKKPLLRPQLLNILLLLVAAAGCKEVMAGVVVVLAGIEQIQDLPLLPVLQ